MSIVRGSVSLDELTEWAEWEIKDNLGLSLPFRRNLPKSWTTLVDGNYYPELWLRYYAVLRHGIECMVVCSDYANHATDENLPIVRDRKLDLKLLLAHAQIQHWVKAREKQTKKGQTNGSTRSRRTTQKEMAWG